MIREDNASASAWKWDPFPPHTHSPSKTRPINPRGLEEQGRPGGARERADAGRSITQPGRALLPVGPSAVAFSPQPSEACLLPSLPNMKEVQELVERHSFNELKNGSKDLCYPFTGLMMTGSARPWLESHLGQVIPRWPSASHSLVTSSAPPSGDNHTHQPDRGVRPYTYVKGFGQ